MTHDGSQSRNGDVSTMTRAEFIDKLRRQSAAVYLACDPSVAQDISESLSHAANLLSVAVSETGAMLPLHDVYDAIKSMDRDQLLDWIEAKRLEAK